MERGPEPYEKGSNVSNGSSSPPHTEVRVLPIQDNEASYRHDGNVNASTENDERKPWWHPIKEPGSAVQIVIAAAVALGTGLGVSAATEVPDAATTLLAIPGQLWLRALTCVGKCKNLPCRLYLVADYEHYSSAAHRVLHDSRCAATARDLKRWSHTCTIHHRFLHQYHAYCQ